MQATPLLLGAVAFATLTGAVSGSSLGSTPIQNRTDPLDEIIARQASAQPTYRLTLPGGPDHYALDTPEGRIEIRELQDHGLHRERTLRQLAIAEVPAPEAEVGQASIATEPLLEETPPYLASPTREQGGSRLIDVGAVLAAR